MPKRPSQTSARVSCGAGAVTGAGAGACTICGVGAGAATTGVSIVTGAGIDATVSIGAPSPPPNNPRNVPRGCGGGAVISIARAASFNGLENGYAAYESRLNKDTDKVPNVVGMSAMDAISVLENVGLRVRFSGLGKVKKQSIKGGRKLVKGKTIVLTIS